MISPLDLLIVGAGPSGLATAIAAHQAGLTYEVVEKGALVNSIFHFPRHMTFFTTAELLEIGARADHAENETRDFASPEEAWRAAREGAGEDDRIVVFGSFLTVAGVLREMALDRR